MNLSELYGEFDLSTGEWSDGVISSIMRITCVGKISLIIMHNRRLYTECFYSDEKPDQKWILFDGPVDAGMQFINITKDNNFANFEI